MIEEIELDGFLRVLKDFDFGKEKDELSKGEKNEK